MTDNLQALLGTSGRGVLATIRRNGRPQLSNVDFCYDADVALIRVSTTTDRAKVAWTGSTASPPNVECDENCLEDPGLRDISLHST
jgi:hypothetical protein